jgi:uncharacterized protein YcsI (UPF0317 family)
MASLCGFVAIFSNLSGFGDNKNMNPDVSPQQLRQLIRDRKWTTPTSCAASGYLQANLVMLPAAEAFNFLLFCVRNPIPCPILDVLEPGRRKERGKGSHLKF